MSSRSIFNAIVEFFKQDDWDFTCLDGVPILSLGFAGSSGRWMCYAQARDDQQQFVFYSVCPLNVPEVRRPAVAEFITRANYGMVLGNFEMDYNDGEVRYKTSIDVEGVGLSAPLVKQVVYANVLITDRYLPGLMAVMAGSESPREAVERVEGAYPADNGKRDFDFLLGNDLDDDSPAFSNGASLN